MKRYAKYKDSGVEWIGDIPEGWKIVRIKFLFKEKQSTKNLELNSGAISFGEVIYKKDDLLLEETKLSYQELLEGEFLINPLNLNYDLKSLRIAKSKIDVVVSQGYIILKLVSFDNPEFIRFVFREFDVKHLKSLGNGVRQTISFKHLSNEFLPLPPLKEQEQIVSYLDEKTSYIDKLLDISKRKIGLLKEQRVSIINQVITKGLNPNAKMKHSGVEWIGDIPEGWASTKLKSIGHFYGGLVGKTGEDFRSEDYSTMKPFIKFTNISNNLYVPLNDFGYVVINENDKQNLVRQYDLFFLMSSETKEDVGKCSCLKDEVGELYLNTFCKGYRIYDNSVSPLFLNYLLSGKIYRDILSNEGNGFTRINLRLDRVNNLQIFLPPLEEQEQIVAYLDEKTSIIDKSISIEERRIGLLKEYRQSIISQVVTGKIKVIADE